MRCSLIALAAMAAILIASPATAHDPKSPELDEEIELELEDRAAEIEAGCFAIFYKHRHGRGPSLHRRGPDEVGDLRYLRYRYGDDLEGDVRSVETGPFAWLELFDKEGFRHSRYRIGPDSEIDLRGRGIDSYRLHCAPPVHW